MNSSRVDVVYQLSQMVSYLADAGIANVYAGIIPPSARMPFVRIADGSGDLDQSALDGTDGIGGEWSLEIVGRSAEEVDPVVQLVVGAMNRPGVSFIVGTLRCDYMRVTSTAFATDQDEQNSEETRFTVTVTAEAFFV